MKQNQNALLAKTEHSTAQYNALLKEYADTFKDPAKRMIFKGARSTYQAEAGWLPEPSLEGFKLVQNTVPNYLEYMKKVCGPHIDNLFAVEATNASGKAVADLVVNGQNWGTLSTLELLRLKSQLDNPLLKEMYKSLPVRDDVLVWRESKDLEAKGEAVSGPIWETAIVSQIKPTTLKESYIIPDPNLKFISEGKGYIPSVAIKDTKVTMGTSTSQQFSGEISHRERATYLQNLSLLKEAVVAALAKANETEVVKSSVTFDRVFGFIHGTHK